MPAKPTILVTGANGQLGRELRDIELDHPGFKFLFTTRESLPITDPIAVADFFKLHQPQFCINAAAYTAVDKAESPGESTALYAVNEEGVRNLALQCQLMGTKMLQVSTDYVFDGTGNRPYKEDDATSPVNVYGDSKLAGEKAALENTDAIVIRTSWVYSSYGNNFVKTMLRLMKEREEVRVVNDQWGSPTYAADLAKAILSIITFQPWQAGIYHFSNEGVISWFDFAEAIKEFSGSRAAIIPIITDQYPTAAKRPAYSVLDKAKIREVFGIRLKPWQDSLGECMARLLNT